MKKLKLIIPVLAFVLAITGVFALKSSATLMPEAKVFVIAASFAITPSVCSFCTVDNDCVPNGDGSRCQRRENGQPAFEVGTPIPCSV